MMKKKIITINEDFLTIKNEKKSKPKKKNIANSSSQFNPSKAKKELLKKIQKYRKDKQRQEEDSKRETKELLQQEFKNDFKDSLDYLKQIIHEKKKKKKKLEFPRESHTSIQNNKLSQPIQSTQNKLTVSNTIDTIQSNIYKDKHETKPDQSIVHMKDIKKDPPYGVLKNGRKPTFRQYYSIKYKPRNHMKSHNANKTLKHRSYYTNTQNAQISSLNLQNTQDTSNDSIQTITEQPQFVSRQKTLQDIKQALQKQKLTNTNPIQLLKSTNNIKKMRKYKVKTVKRKYRLGKSNKNGSTNLSLLVKNNKTIKKLKDELNTLNKIPMIEIKNFLKQKHLVKNGSNAPDHILRQIYKQSILSGDVLNDNPDIMIHNFMPM